ncbi:hypothetical protein QZH41_019544 [Actinostola sp. cb2023]|nr:hypothetical protein QZH41_019544 [Actinostola sp. cb2023]
MLGYRTMMARYAPRIRISVWVTVLQVKHIMSENTNMVLTVSQLIKEDLEEAYFFPAFPSSYCTNYRFLNNTEYQLYDYPPNSLTYNEIVYPRTHFCTAGDDIPVLTDHPPPEFLKQHWKTWLADFPLAKFISIDDGLKDDNIPIVTCSAFQGIPRNKHSIDPDILYKLQLKSSIPEIGVPCPRHMDEKNVEFPCVVKVDLTYPEIRDMPGRAAHYS